MCDYRYIYGYIVNKSMLLVGNLDSISVSTMYWFSTFEIKLCKVYFPLQRKNINVFHFDNIKVKV